jgi:hypothetical protein
VNSVHSCVDPFTQKRHKHIMCTGDHSPLHSSVTQIRPLYSFTQKRPKHIMCTIQQSLSIPLKCHTNPFSLYYIIELLFIYENITIEHMKTICLPLFFFLWFFFLDDIFFAIKNISGSISSV